MYEAVRPDQLSAAPTELDDFARGEGLGQLLESRLADGSMIVREAIEERQRQTFALRKSFRCRLDQTGHIRLRNGCFLARRRARCAAVEIGAAKAQQFLETRLDQAVAEQD